MTFKRECVPEFIALFQERKEKIRHFDGCTRLELLRDKGNETVYFTYSFWNSEQDLDRYRNSELFRDTWKLTKALFRERAEAWTVEQQLVV